MRTSLKSLRPNPRSLVSTLATFTPLCAVAAALTLTSCSDKEDDAGSKGFDSEALKASLFLSESELATKNTKEVPADEVTSEVNGLSDLYANEPEENDEEEDEDKALDACLDKNLKGSVVADGTTFKVEFSAPKFECTTDDGVKMTYEAYQYLFHGQCEEMTEKGKAFNGKSLAELLATEMAADEEVCVQGKEHRFVTQMKLKVTAVGKVSELPFTSKGTVVESTTASDGSPCVSVADTVSDCVVTKVVDSNIDVNGSVTKDVQRTVLAFKDVKESKAGQTYFDAGTVTMTLADWSGSATYSSADAAPKWTLKRDSTTKTGTFGKAETPTSTLDARANVLRASDVLRLARTALRRSLPRNP